MLAAKPGEIWMVDLGMAAKVRPRSYAGTKERRRTGRVHGRRTHEIITR